MLEDITQGREIPVDEAAVKRLSESIAEHVKNRLTPRTGSRKDKVLWMSEVGKTCKRQLWYNHRPETPKESLPPNASLKFLYGEILEDLLLFLAEQAGHEVTDRQKVCEIALPNGWKIRGRMDAKIDGILTDVKSASTYAFVKFEMGNLKDDDPFGYLSQLGLYNQSEDTKEGTYTAFFVIDKTLGHVTVDTYTYKGDPEHTKSIGEKDLHALVELTSLIETEKPPDQLSPVPDGKSGNLKLCVTCSYCEYKNHCWKDSNEGRGLRYFSYSGKPVAFTKIEKEPRVVEVTKIE
jgi:hypothetical protein